MCIWKNVIFLLSKRRIYTGVGDLGRTWSPRLSGVASSLKPQTSLKSGWTKRSFWIVMQDQGIGACGGGYTPQITAVGGPQIPMWSRHHWHGGIPHLTLLVVIWAAAAAGGGGDRRRRREQWRGGRGSRGCRLGRRGRPGVWRARSPAFQPQGR